MGYFSAQELASIKNEVKPKAPQKTKGRGGFISSLISEAGGTGGAAGGAALGTALLPGVGTLLGAGIGGFLGGTGGRVVENKVRDDRIGLGDALKEGAISGIAGAGPIKLAKAGKGAITGGVEGANEAIKTPILNKLTDKTRQAGQRLTEAGSGLKADPTAGGVAKLDENAQFMSKYTGSPRQQRVKMETDMKDLSRQVDEKLAANKVPVVGVNMSAKLRNAIDDPNVFPNLDLTQKRAVTLLEKNMKILESKTDAKELNDFVKTLNPTASAARDKLANGSGRALTPNETAALATKKVIDEELGTIPEISSLKKNMAQIFDVTPQVAKQAEKGLSTPFLGGIKLKSPVQATSAVQSKLGSVLQGQSGIESPLPGATGFASRILAGRGVDSALNPEDASALEQPEAMPSENIGSQAKAVTADDVLAAQEAAGGSEDTDPYSPANIQATVKSIIAQGGTQKDVAEFLSNAKTVNDLTAASGGAEKPLSAEASKIVSNAKTGIQALDDFEQALQDDPSVAAKRVIPGRGFLGGLVGNALGTNGADAAATQIVDVIARLRTGAAITNSEAKRFETFIPQAFDDPETRAQKINYLRNQFEMVANRTGSAGSDLQSSIAQ